MDVLNELFYGLPCRFVLHIVFLVLPAVSYGQGLHTSDNTLPIFGLENVYVAQQQKIEPVLFVASGAIISKSATVTFFVNGSIQMDGFLVAQTDTSKYPTPLPEKASIKIKPIAKEAVTEVKQCNNQVENPYLPLKKNPLQQEKHYTVVAAVSIPSTPELKKKDNRQFQLLQSSADLLRIVTKTECYTTYCTCSVTATFRKTLTEFSSRPPPAIVGTNLYLPVAGFRISNTVTISNPGGLGVYWSSTVSGTNT